MNFLILDQCVVQVRDGGGCNCKAAGWKRITKKVMIMSRNQRKFAQGWDDELFNVWFSRILIKSDDCAILEEFRSEFQCQMIMSRNQRKFAEGMYGFIRSLQLCK